MVKFRSEYSYSDVTSKSNWLNRRKLILGGTGALIAGTQASKLMALQSLPTPGSSQYSTDQEPNSFEDITTYNNFYEFGTRKGDPAKNAHMLTTEPWTVTVDGLCENPGNHSVEDLVATYPIEERIYRLRCVEAWSMVVPWIGFELNKLIEDSQPSSNANFVAFETLVRPEEMVGQRSGVLEWPYREGLRLDEAMNPLTILSVGLYGEVLPNQNGAPIRLVVPWKYGFKSIKSIVRITFTEEMPLTSWWDQNPREYGFYSNVNPSVSHPRWSQAAERVIGTGLFAKKVPTQMFNGYGEYVAHLYEGMDLTENY